MLDIYKLNIWHYAAHYGRLEILKEILLKTNEKINDGDKYGQTPLMHAVEQN